MLYAKQAIWERGGFTGNENLQIPKSEKIIVISVLNVLSMCTNFC